MDRALRTNLVLAAVALALGALAWWQVQGEIDAREPPLAAIDPGSIDHIRVGCAGCTPREFARTDTGWRMLAPYALDADDTAIARLLAIPASPVRLRQDAGDIEPAKIGLDPPLMTLELGGTRIDVGTTDALRGDRYVRDGARIARVPDRFSPFLMATPESELDRRLVPRGATVVRWRVDGIEVSVDGSVWRELRAARITPVDATAQAEGPSRRIAIDLGDGSTFEWTLLRIGDDWIARRASPALDYHLAAADARRLVEPAPTR